MDLQKLLANAPKGQEVAVVHLRTRTVHMPDGREVEERYAERQVIGIGTGAAQRARRDAIDVDDATE